MNEPVIWNGCAFLCEFELPPACAALAGVTRIFVDEDSFLSRARPAVGDRLTICGRVWEVVTVGTGVLRAALDSAS
jgi:hypothetical protein